MRVPIADEVKAGREMLLHVLALSLSVRREAKSATPVSRIGPGALTTVMISAPNCAKS
jgi:hypothetical protein